MKKNLIFIVICMSILGLALECAAQESAKEIKYGVASILSGGGAALGLPVARAYEMAAKEIGVFSVAGQTYKWAILTEDTKYTSAGGVSAARKLIFQDKVKVLVEVGTSPAMAAQPIVQGEKILYHSWSTPTETLGPKYPRTYRAYVGAYDQAPPFMDWISKNYPNMKKFMAVAPDDATGYALADAFGRAAKQLCGADVLKPEFYPRATTDFYPLVTKVLLNKIDMIYFEGGASGGAFFKSARQLGYKGQFAAISIYPGWVETAGQAAMEGLLMTDPAIGGDLTPKGWNNLFAAYKEKYKESSGATIRHPFNDLHVLTAALKKAGNVDDVDKIMRVMETVSFETPIGTLLFGGEALYGINHQLCIPCFVSGIKDGKEVSIARIEAPEVAKLYTKVYGKK